MFFLCTAFSLYLCRRSCLFIFWNFSFQHELRAREKAPVDLLKLAPIGFSSLRRALRDLAHVQVQCSV